MIELKEVQASQEKKHIHYEGIMKHGLSDRSTHMGWLIESDYLFAPPFLSFRTLFCHFIQM